MSSDCIIFTGPKTKFGYGKQKYKGKQVSSHRVAYEKAYGHIAEGMCVLHKCDNPSCVNPEHLFLGTHKDNMNDMFAKGRANRAKGTNNGMAKLTEKEVLEIREAQLPYPDIGRAFGVSSALVCLIKNKKVWKHL